MNAPVKLGPPMSRKTDQELLAMLASPADCPPETLDAAKLELWKRHSGTSRAGSAQIAATVLAPPQLSSLAVYSLVLCLLPYFGLPMAVAALRRIARSEGRLYGRKLAWASVFVNVLSLVFMLGVMVLTVVLGLV